MVLNNCTVCSVYVPEDGALRRIRVKCAGDRITLFLKRENELPDSERIRIDFFDGQIGCIKTYCELMVRRNYDSSVAEPWIADCEILEVAEIVQGRRNLRAKMEKEITMNSLRQGEFSGDIQNVSTDGIYFITRTRLREDDTVEFAYSFVEKEYPLKAIVLREEDFRDGRYGYGCRFLDFPKGAQRDIQQYIFKRQHGRMW